MRLSHLTLSLSIALMFGCKGDKGAVGPAGEDGAPGETGPAGEAGADGEDGEDGEDAEADADSDADADADTDADGSTGSVYLGDLIIADEVEATYFCDNYDRVYGSLHVKYSADDASAIDCLVEVTQDFDLEGGHRVEMNLPNLERIGGNFKVIGDAATVEARFDSLLFVGGQMHVEGVGLEAFEPTIAFPVLAAVSSSLLVRNMGTATIILPMLTTVGQLNIEQGVDLVHLDGISALETVEGQLIIERNDSLTDISALSSITTVTGDVLIRHNPLLPTSQAETLAATIAEIGGTVLIEGNGPD